MYELIYIFIGSFIAIIMIVLLYYIGTLSKKTQISYMEQII